MLTATIAADRNEIDKWVPTYLGCGVAFGGIGALIGWAVDAGRSKPYVRYDGAPPNDPTTQERYRPGGTPRRPVIGSFRPRGATSC